MEESEGDSIRPGKYDRPTGLRVRKWLCPTRCLVLNMTGQPVSLKTPARPFSH